MYVHVISLHIYSPSGYGQQCCYINGNLVVGNSGGSVDKVAPSDVFGHIREDIIPSVFCCRGEASDCSTYYRHRPSDNGSTFNPPNPGNKLVCDFRVPI